MLGHYNSDETCYALQAFKDNFALLTPEVLNRINQVVIKTGHRLAQKNKDRKLNACYDSYFVETDVHYPTDINLLFEAIGKMITMMARLSSKAGVKG